MMLDWDTLYAECMSCQKCGLAETRTNVVFGEGPRDAEVMFIGEGPGWTGARCSLEIWSSAVRPRTGTP